MAPAFVLVLVLGTVSPAAAQQVEPIGMFVADVRGTLARFKQDGAIASFVGVTPEDLPTRGLGLALGAHLYPLRKGRVTLGIGGEILWARDSRTGEAPDPPAVPPAVPVPPPPTVTTRLSSIAPHLSLNFGHGEGWSYVSGGIGLATLSAERDDVPAADADSTRMTHYGGGARWFTSPHLAFTFDVRFYAINGRPAAGTTPEFPKSRMMVISVGASFK
jgi:hypothetical protein